MSAAEWIMPTEETETEVVESIVENCSQVDWPSGAKDGSDPNHHIELQPNSLEEAKHNCANCAA